MISVQRNQHTEKNVWLAWCSECEAGRSGTQGQTRTWAVAHASMRHGHSYSLVLESGLCVEACKRCVRPLADCVGHIRERKPAVPAVPTDLPLPELAAVEVHRVREQVRYESKMNARKRKRAKKRRAGK